ncbi:FecR family protein [Sphingobium vermicomposti]|uniref:Transmembrane sensor n=1 Tax=Sphingobium vermicomposti TaxID=529005 RepID=A0A846M8G5_9SPHN|nr:FecR domain-containing protein [Sphingobium vermicomposti]NIJ17753.1 transmembrane sensor [Sphingobium vermicomposti]
MNRSPSSPMAQHDAMLQDMLVALRDSSPMVEARNYVDALERRRAKWHAFREWLWPRAFAAGICAAAAIAFFAIFLPAPPSDEVIASLVGERKEIALADGSHVTLDTDSAVSVRLADDERRLVLLKGRASFAVAHDPQRPFRVTSGMMTVTAIGTDFDVSAVGKDRTVTLVHGRVSVETSYAQGRQKPQRTMLSPGEQITMTADGAMGRPTAVDAASMTAWREGRLEFTRASVADAVAEANRYSARKIRLVDAGLGSRQLEGSFRVGQMDAFANALCAFFDLKIVRRTDNEILLGPMD